MDMGTLDVNTPVSGGAGKPPTLLIGAGIVGVLALVVILQKKNGSGGSPAITPSSNANIAFSSLENSLLNFQGLYEANTAQFNAEQKHMEDLIGQNATGTNKRIDMSIFNQGIAQGILENGYSGVANNPSSPEFAYYQNWLAGILNSGGLLFGWDAVGGHRNYNPSMGLHPTQGANNANPQNPGQLLGHDAPPSIGEGAATGVSGLL